VAESIDTEKRLEDLIRKLDRAGVQGPGRTRRMLNWYFAKYERPVRSQSSSESTAPEPGEG
jgi:hypothetical protein